MGQVRRRDQAGAHRPRASSLHGDVLRHVHGAPGHQIVSASLKKSRGAARPRRTKSPWGCRPAYLIDEVVAIKLSGFLSRALGYAHAVALSWPA